MQVKKKEIIKQEKGAVTALVLFTVLIFITILGGSYFVLTSLQKSQLKSDLRIQEIYEQEVYQIDEIYQEVEARLGIPELWKKASDITQWYSYGEAKINEPKLVGNMTPIVYSNEQTGNKWANAITKDGSMFVWIPRYAYKITEGYQKNQAGTIEIKFIDINNNCLDGTNELIEVDPSKITYTTDSSGNQVQDQWLVHPAFTKIAENGGGFSDSQDSNKELSGLWVGKFETTGTVDKVTVKPGEETIVQVTVNEAYQAGKKATFGEKVNLQNHMLKNSEWGAIVYLAHSQYGVNGQEIEAQTVTSSIAGGVTNVETIYEDESYKKHSTTYNAYGVYDLNGGANEYVASYLYNEQSQYLNRYGGEAEGDIFGANVEEQSTSTAYKTIYKDSGSTDNSFTNVEKANYILNSTIKGDAMYETSNNGGYNSTGAWFLSATYFPYITAPFIARGGRYNENSGKSSTFFYNSYYGSKFPEHGFRMCLAI